MPPVLNRLLLCLGQVLQSNFIIQTSFDVSQVYQGEHDSSDKLTGEELEKMIAFTRNLFTPTTHEQYRSVNGRVPKDLINLSAPVVSPEELDKVLDTDDSDAKAVLKRINALKVLRNDTSPDSFTSESVNGYVVRLERGKLGLVKA